MTDATQSKKRFPIFRAVYRSFTPFMDNFKLFLLIGSVFSLIIMLFNFFIGQSFFCITENLRKYAFCSIPAWVYIIASIILWFVGCMYMRIWYQTALLNEAKFSLKSLKPKWTDLKIYGVIILYFLSICIALGSGFLLFIRVPNPDWRIEMLYFAVVSVGFFAPMFATPILSYIGFVAEGKSLPKIKDLWQSAKGNIVLIFVSFVSVVLIGFLASNTLLRYFMEIGNNGNIFVVVIAEFLYNMIVMFIATIFASYCYIQKKFLFERD